MSIDVCRPPLLAGTGIEYVDLELDLELDLAWSPGEPVHVVDRDELAAEVSAGRVAAREAAQVLVLGAQLQQRLQQDDPLFSEVGWRYLSAAAAAVAAAGPVGGAVRRWALTAASKQVVAARSESVAGLSSRGTGSFTARGQGGAARAVCSRAVCSSGAPAALRCPRGPVQVRSVRRSRAAWCRR
ncbi:DUF402 domain-containing protein [Kineococcus sp. SYSU DK005]|uniref:DUF402 domain-containing protein n=1 Tax=Kineococcus sp. SYSU DK005 TaxID=3383126 RepID=UPI003D7DB71F